MANSDSELHVVFGTGPLGRGVASELRSRGKHVRVASRTGRVDIPVDGLVEVVHGDATDPAVSTHLCQGATTVYHCAAPPFVVWPQRFPALTGGILAGAASAGAVMVFGDNLHMYGPVSGPLTEDLPYRPAGPHTRARAEAARMVLDAHERGTVRATIGRASGFYGPWVVDGMLGESLFGAAIAGKPVNWLGNPDALYTYTYIDDFARALVTLGERGEALGRVWHVPSGDAVTARQFIQQVLQEAGSDSKLRVAPRLLVTLMSYLDPKMRGVKEMLHQFEGPYVVDHTRFDRIFGCDVTPQPEAIRRTVAWFKSAYRHRRPGCAG